MSNVQYARPQARQAQSARPSQSARPAQPARQAAPAPQAPRPSHASAQQRTPANSQQPPAADQRRAYDVITSGVAYLNRVRWVPVRKGQPYLACTVNAMMGVDNDVTYVSYDCNVVGEVAREVVGMLTDDVNDKAKVIIGFRIGDAKPEMFEFPDKATGEMVQRLGMKGRLLQVTFAKVNGQRIDIPLVERPEAGDDTPAGSGPSDDGEQSEQGHPGNFSQDDDAAGSACEDSSSYRASESDDVPA